jgi:predicted esterase YcpF (UPF0227 family)
MLLYIHGFNSSPASHKARVVKQRLEALGRRSEFACPALPDRPAHAMAMLEEQLSRAQLSEVTLVGSSLGGYYATYLAEKLGMRAVLVNPAVDPYVGLQAYLGTQKNIYTGATYQLTLQHLTELRVLDVDRPTLLARYYLMVTTGDEVLDYRKAVQKYLGAKQLVVPGSDHGFGDFGNYLDSVLEFAGIV